MKKTENVSTPLRKKKQVPKMTFQEAVKEAKRKIKISKATVKGMNECPIWSIKKSSKNIQIMEALLDMLESLHDVGCKIPTDDYSYTCGTCEYCKGLSEL